MKGVLFRNHKNNDKQPDFKGTLDIDGKTLEIAGWVTESSNNIKYLSLKADWKKEKEEKQDDIILSDDLPF